MLPSRGTEMKKISRNNDGDKNVLLWTITKTRIDETKNSEIEYPYKGLERIKSNSSGCKRRYTTLRQVIVHRTREISMKDLLSTECPLN
jgi:hypothetical protein